MSKGWRSNLATPIVSLLLTMLLVLAPLVGPVPVAHAATTFNVDSLTDAHDANPGDGFCDNGVDGCSLRAAIEEAASASPPVTIHMSGLSGSTFYLTLGMIYWTASDTTLDGQTDSITIDASGLAAGQSAIQISGDNNIIENLTIRGAPMDAIQVGDFSGTGYGNSNTVQYVTLISNGTAGVYVHGSSSGGSQNNTIGSSLIGTTSSSATACTVGNGGDGVLIDSSATGTTIASNYIVCNGAEGVYINGDGGAPHNTMISSNDIGTNGNVALPNNGQGILDSHGVGTTIYANIISGNGAAGIWLFANQDAVIRRNYVGLDGIGNAAIPNSLDGVAITDGATNASMGGTLDEDRNYISGNGWCGVRIRDGATGTILNGNVIGMNPAGAAVPNGTCGVAVTNANGNTIGSDGNPISQAISGNAQQGIWVSDSSSTSIGSSTLIGVALDGSTARGNGSEGIILITASNTLARPDVIMNNGGAGIAVTGNGTGNMLLPAMDSSNGGLAIDLGNDGFTANGSQTPPGPNNWIGYPVITSVNGSLIAGTACNICEVHIYQAVGNPTANGGGGIYVGWTLVDASGNWSYTLPSGLTASQVTLQALDASTGDSSEMSPLHSSPASYSVFLPIVVKH